MSLKYLPRRLRKVAKLVRTQRYRKGLRLGVAAAIEHVGAMHTAPMGTLIDVGANIGQFSLLVREVYPDAVIHAFEPLAAMADKYTRLFAGDPRITLHRCAAGASRATAEINVSGRPDSSSLLPISSQQALLFPGTEKAAVETVRVECIDDVLQGETLPGPIMVKIDVQGFELEALKGMVQLLRRVQWIYVEVSFMSLYVGQPLANEVFAWLKDHGFEMAGTYNATYSDQGASIQTDILFTRIDATGQDSAV